MGKMNHYNLEEIERKVGEFQEEKDSKKSKILGMLLIASYGKIFNITESGVKRGLELFEKYDEDDTELTHNEWFSLYVLIGESLLMEGWEDAYEVNVKLQKQLFKRYKPDYFYIQGIILSSLYPKQLVKLNENFYNGFKVLISVMDRYPKLKDLLITGDV
jgi:hypothetical protein